jgi:hypothetical protein
LGGEHICVGASRTLALPGFTLKREQVQSEKERKKERKEL